MPRLIFTIKILYERRLAFQMDQLLQAATPLPNSSSGLTKQSLVRGDRAVRTGFEVITQTQHGWPFQCGVGLPSRPHSFPVYKVATRISGTATTFPPMNGCLKGPLEIWQAAGCTSGLFIINVCAWREKKASNIVVTASEASSGELCRLWRLRAVGAGSTGKTLRPRGKSSHVKMSRLKLIGSGTILAHKDSVSETDIGSSPTPDSFRGFLCNVKCVRIQQHQWIDCNGFEWDLPSLFPKIYNHT